MELLRSLIFVPGNRANMLERALNFDADIIMVDLEDSVPPGGEGCRPGRCRGVDSQAPPGRPAGNGAGQFPGHGPDPG